MFSGNTVYRRKEKKIRLDENEVAYLIPPIKHYKIPRIPKGLFIGRGEEYLQYLIHFLNMPIIADTITDHRVRRQLREKLQEDQTTYRLIMDNALRFNAINYLNGTYFMKTGYQGTNSHVFFQLLERLDTEIEKIKVLYSREEDINSTNALKKLNKEKIGQLERIRAEVEEILHFLSRQNPS